MPVTRLLLDNNVSRRLCPLLLPREAVHTSQMDWAGLKNGELLRAAEEHGFHMLITGDRNMRYQQNLTRIRFSIIELSTQQLTDNPRGFVRRDRSNRVCPAGRVCDGDAAPPTIAA